ncbi:mucin-12 isoform X2 [Nematostella vectensis]|nr:mucin-12 isoform X2 [Nematostella vectensis]
MTTSSGVVSSKDESGNKEGNSDNSLEEGSAKGTIAIHETRSQKLSKLGSETQEESIKSSSSVASEISLPAPGVSTRSSSRPAKRQKLSNELISAIGSQDLKDESSTGSTAQTQKQTPGRVKKKRVKRQWESWVNRDKNAFFKALHDYGKDFDKIQSFIATKHKRRGDPLNLVKNKDQVRHFYYRTLNKILKYIPEDKQPTGETDPHQRTTNELFALMCYGEMRKKVCGGLCGKQWKKLTELMADGRASIRQNGRIIRLRAPTFKSTKEAEQNQGPPLPQKLLVEFLPVDNVAWATVQNLSQNPRLRTSVRPKRPLSVMLSYLMNKWPVKSPFTGEAQELCVSVPVGFDSLEESTASPFEIQAATPPNVVTCTVGQSTNNELTNEHESSTGSPAQADSSLLSSVSGRSTGIAPSKDTKCPSCGGPYKKCACDKKSPGKGTQDKPRTENSTSVTKLWTSETCGSITVGEIYCKLKRPPKLKFEYSWMKEDTCKTTYCSSSLHKLIDVAKTEFQNLRRSKAASKENATKENASAPLANVTKTTRIAPKLSLMLPTIGPSLGNSSVDTFAVPTQSTNSYNVAYNARKRARRRREYAGPPTKKLLPRPGQNSAIPKGAVAVSFIPQPGQAVGTILASNLHTGAGTGYLPIVSMAHSTAVKSGTRGPPKASSSSTTTTSSISAASQATTTTHTMPLTPAASPVSFSDQSAGSPMRLSEPVTTVLESGVQHPITDQCSLSPDISMLPITAVPTTAGFTSSERSSLGALSLNPQSGIPFTDVSIPMVCTPLDGFPCSTGTNVLDSIISLTPGKIGQFDSSVTMNEDSTSELLASIMGLTKTTSGLLVSQTVSTHTTASTGIMSTAEPHVEELNSGISSEMPTSFGGLGDLLSGTSSSTLTPGFFSNSAVTVSSVVTSDKLLSGGITSTTSPITSPRLSPIRTTSEQPWLNGGDTSDSFSFLDKIIVSPEKERHPVPTELPVATMDTASQDLLLTHKHLPIGMEAIQTMMDENSVDYVKKFQDLVKDISAENNSSDSSGSGNTLSFRNILSKNIPEDK